MDYYQRIECRNKIIIAMVDAGNWNKNDISFTVSQEVCLSERSILQYIEKLIDKEIIIQDKNGILRRTNNDQDKHTDKGITK